VKDIRKNLPVDLPINLNVNNILIDLQRIIKQPSVSAKNQGLQDCANLIMKIMNKDGIDAELLYLNINKKEKEDRVFDNKSNISTNNSSINNSTLKNSSSYSSSSTNILSQFSSKQKPSSSSLPPPPIVYGEVKSKSNPNGKTILFYNHYDIQPEGPIELWNDDPFIDKIDENYIYGG
jgi:acetylornithine deacetylase/succinyl-diaminopimelate desuccinylase-like protein